jgi:hypothetical protein
MEKKKRQPTTHQAKNRQTAHLSPWQWKKGQSGNPNGRPAGISLKEYAKMMLNRMTDEEREEFFHGIDKRVIWEMAEGKAEAKTDVTTNGKDMPTPIINFNVQRNDSDAESDISQ